MEPAYDYAAATGEIDNRRVLATVAAEEGAPDGLCIDAEGFVWVAHWDGWCVSRFDPAGRRERKLRVPVPRPTSLCFGGRDLDRLYITSAAMDLDKPALGKPVCLRAGRARLAVQRVRAVGSDSLILRGPPAAGTSG